MRAADRDGYRRGSFCTEGDPQKNEPRHWRLGKYLVSGPQTCFFDENSNWALFWIILISNFTVRLTNSGPGMVLRLPRCALIFKPFSGDWKMVGIRKPSDFFQFFQCHLSREERIVLRKCNLLLSAFLGTKRSTSTQNQGLITKKTKNSQPYLNPINLVQRRKQNFAIWVDWCWWWNVYPSW